MNNYVKVLILWVTAGIIIPNIVGWLNSQGILLDNRPSIPINYELTPVKVANTVAVEPINNTTVTEPINYTTILKNIKNPQGRLFVLKNNPNAHNPTWDELYYFLRNDKTDEIPYDIKSFTCGDFAERLHNNAEANNIRSAFVAIRFNTDNISSLNTYHALNAFEVVDNGKKYIDDTSNSKNSKVTFADKIVGVRVGGTYVPIGLFPDLGQEIWWGSMGIVESIYIEQW